MATTNVGRMAVWIVGLFLVLLSIFVLWDALGLERWVPTAVIVALMILVLGIGVMAMANRYGFWGTRRVERVEHTGRAYGPYENRPATYPEERVASQRVVEEEGGGRYAP